MGCSSQCNQVFFHFLCFHFRKIARNNYVAKIIPAIFFNRTKKRLITITQWFHKFVQRHGLPDVHIHSLRHTYASLMIADGTPLVVVSHNLGHAQVSTTSNIYSHVIASAEAQADRVFDRYADTVQSIKKEGEKTTA